ncbi:MAG: hypothetical protein NTZ34_12125 [Chloroflexi bacterium]|nr:hypothetical protein [Chloroflexota bacterium]
MKPIYYSFIALIAALAILMPAASPVMADQDETSKPQLQSAPALMIKAPNIVEVSQPLTITVFSKRGHETIAGASVYALKTSDLIVTADSMNYKTLLSEYEATAKAKGTLIGTTSENGTVTGALSETGRFMLVATKDGFMPGFTRLTVTLAPKKALNIKARGSIEINKPVTISVTERFKQQAVEGTSVYAMLIAENNTLHINALSTVPKIKIPAPAHIQTQAKALGETHGLMQVKASKVENQVLPGWQGQAVKPFWTADNATVIRSDPWEETTSADYAAEIQSGGFLLGNTDVNGQLTYTFTEKGTYVLVAIKEGYIPGFAKISVHTANQDKLIVKAPVSAPSGQSVSIKVIESNTGLPSENATIYAFVHKTGIPPTVKPSPAPTENGTATQILIDSATDGAVNTKELQSLLVQSAIQPITIGTTDTNGEIQYTFSNPGQYTLVAVKDGYLPGGARINILGLQTTKTLVINAVFNITTGQPVTIKVWEKSSSQPVSGAAVYVLKISDTVGTKYTLPFTSNNKGQDEIASLT